MPCPTRFWASLTWTMKSMVGHLWAPVTSLSASQSGQPRLPPRQVWGPLWPQARHEWHWLGGAVAGQGLPCRLSSCISEASLHVGSGSRLFPFGLFGFFWVLKTETQTPTSSVSTVTAAQASTPTVQQPGAATKVSCLLTPETAQDSSTSRSMTLLADPCRPQDELLTHVTKRPWWRISVGPPL